MWRMTCGGARQRASRAPLVQKSLKKVEHDERLWERYLGQHPLNKHERASFPSIETVVAFGAWTTRERRNACVAQRDDDGPAREGLGRHNARWGFENPLRVCDVSFATRALVIEDESGAREGTSHMQFAWRRLKRRYWEVYFFRSALTANDRAAVRRVTVRIRAFMIRTARFRACRQGLTPAKVER